MSAASIHEGPIKTLGQKSDYEELISGAELDVVQH